VGWRDLGTGSLVLLALGASFALSAGAQPEDPCAVQRDAYIALASHGPPQTQAAFDELKEALEALFTCHNPGTSLSDFGDLNQFFVPATPTPTP
jgi:hypothetical protein